VAVLQGLQKALQGRQQGLLVVEGQALPPQGVVLVEQADLGHVAIQPVEQLQAVGTPAGQEQSQVVSFQGMSVEVQRAVLRQLFAQRADQAGQVGQALVAYLAGLQLQQVVTLLDLQKQTAGRLFGKTLQGFAEQFLDALGNRAGPVAAITAHQQLGVRSLGRQAVEVVAQAVEQRIRTAVATDQQLVPAVQGDLVEAQYEIFTHPGIAQCVGARAGQVDIQLAVRLQRVAADIHQQQHPTRLAGLQQGAFRDAG